MDSLPLLGAMPWQWAHGKGNVRGGHELATDRHKGTHRDGNGGGGPTLTTDTRRNNNGKCDVRGGPAHALGKKLLYRMDTTAGAGAHGAKHYHKQEARGATGKLNNQPNKRGTTKGGGVMNVRDQGNMQRRNKMERLRIWEMQ